MDVRSDIRDWLYKQPDWMQEAAEKLLVKGDLDADDVTAISSLIKTSVGQKPSNHRPFEELKQAATTHDELRLVKISDVAGIENLAPKHPLLLGKENLTVIYGHNGSGKSSYTRLLKKIAGKPRAVELKTNVFDLPPDESKCHITSSVNGVESLSEWTVGTDPIHGLRGLDIFDSEEAKHYLSAESPATYVPGILGLFEGLAGIAERIKGALTAEQSALVSALPAMPTTYQDTEASRQYSALTTITPSVLSEALTWTTEHEAKLAEISERLKIDDPGALAQQKRRTKTELERAIASLTQASIAYSPANLESLRSSRTNAQAKRQIALEAAQVKSAVLEGVGTTTWRAMWSAARLYSATPYPNGAFPVTTDARCVLCQQDLSPAAQERLNDFEAFVQGTLESDAAAAEAIYEDNLRKLTLPPSDQQTETQCEASGLASEDWKKYIKAYWQQVSVAQTAFRNEELVQHAPPVENISEGLVRLADFSEQLEKSAAQFDEDALQFDRAQALKDKLGYEAKKWMAQQADAIKAESARLLEVKNYEKWKALTGSRSISLKAAEITQKVVTEAYVTRFNKELVALGASRLRVELKKTKTRNAKVLHQLRLKGALNERDLPESILSDGERRIISLAAFLADVCDKPGATPFVFDDPISSLDHDFEWHVACRLVELAKTRQVIILTHRLSLYGTLEDVAKKAGDAWKDAHYRPMCIEAYAGGAGHPADQDVWNANTKKANNILLMRLAAAKKVGDAEGAGAYRAFAQGICSEFRKLLERSVEEDLLNKVVVRHRRSVTTDGRLKAVSGIAPEDCVFIDSLMTKYSCYEHSQSREIPVLIPEEPELRIDIEALKTWRDDLSARRSRIAALSA